jgi:predicted membrane-bound mannosyltransferase
MNPPNEIQESVRDPARPSFNQSWLGRGLLNLATTAEGRYLAGFMAITFVALALRLWELTGRTMHYDEAIHLYYSWRLSNLDGFVHSPWMHGPFQIELVALFLRLFGDTDFAARLAYALFGTTLVAIPFFLREHLGRAGAMLTGIMLAISPSLLYFSRFGRNDIIMAVLTVSLFALLWSYTRNPRNRYLYLASAVLAVAFAAKETAYIVAAIFGALALLLAIPWTNVVASLSVRLAKSSVVIPVDPPPAHADQEPEKRPSGGPPTGGVGTRIWKLFYLSHLNPAAGFLLLLITLTLPLWSAGIELIREIATALAGLVNWASAREALQSGFGLILVGRDAVSQGIVGAPVWEAPFVQLPLPTIAGWVAGVVSVMVIAACGLVGWRVGDSRVRQIGGVGIPLGVSCLAGLALLRPTGSILDAFLTFAIAAICLAAFVLFRFPWRHSFFLIFFPFMVTSAYWALFLPVVDVNALLPSILPEGVEVSSTMNGIPLNYLVAGGILLAMIVLSLALGLCWKGGVWLTCAAIFGTIWVALYTTFFTNLAGIFSGTWQGMGYWIAQQEVARGNQPWYYYFVGMSVYEFLPLLFGSIAAALFVLRRDQLGMALAFWAFINLLAYTIASEKMPWLLVNITLPFIFLAGKLLGELVDRITWAHALEASQRLSSLMLLAIPAFTIAAGCYVALSFTNNSGASNYPALFLLAAILLLALFAAWLVRQSAPDYGTALATLGIAGFLAAATAWVAIQAAYTYDDSRPEILVYAQGSYDLRQSLDELDREFLQTSDSTLISSPVRVDYDAWFPLQWYVRQHDQEGHLRFSCFKDEDGEGGCSSPPDGPEASAFLVASHNRPPSSGSMRGFKELETRRNLLWFPETYRRPGEDRQSEEAVEEVIADLKFLRDAATDREKWGQALKYHFTRDMESDWFKSEYYTYVRQDPTASGGLR